MGSWRLACHDFKWQCSYVQTSAQDDQARTAEVLRLLEPERPPTLMMLPSKDLLSGSIERRWPACLYQVLVDSS